MSHAIMLWIPPADKDLAARIAQAQGRATGHRPNMDSVLRVALHDGLRRHAELEGVLQPASEAGEDQKMQQ